MGKKKRILISTFLVEYLDYLRSVGLTILRARYLNE